LIVPNVEGGDFEGDHGMSEAQDQQKDCPHDK